MKQLRKNESGFSVIDVAVVVALLILIGAVGYLVAKHVENTQRTTTAYSGWKTYCDDEYKYCFRYPPSWSLQVANAATIIGNPTQVTLISPSFKTQVWYLNSASTSPHPNMFKVSGVDSGSLANQSLDIISGNFAGGNYTPFYIVAAAALLKDNLVSVGKTIQVYNVSHFFDKNSSGGENNQVKFESQPAGITFTSTSQALNWFNTSEAKTSLKILKSLYYQ